MKKTMFFVLLLFSINLVGAEWMVKTKMANMRKEPNPKSKVVYKLSQYESVQILKRYKDWVKVKTVDDHIGWVHKSVIEELKVEDEDSEETGVETKKESNNENKPKENTSTSSSQFVIVPAENLSSQSQMQTTSQIQPVSKQPEIINVSKKEEKLLSREYKIKNTSERRRVIGDHIFPSTVLFPTPIPSARFGFSQGFAMLKGDYLNYYYDYTGGENCIQDPDNPSEYICFYTSNLSWYGFNQKFNSGIFINDIISLDLDANINLEGGMENKDIVSVNANPNGVVKLGAIFVPYKGDNGLMISFPVRITYSMGIDFSFQSGIEAFFYKLGKNVVDQIQNDPNLNFPPKNINDFFNIINSSYVKSGLGDAIKSFTGSLVSNESSFGISPSIGVVYPIKNWLGVQAVIEYNRLKEKSKTKTGGTKTERNNYLNYGIATSIDFRHLIKFPLGTILEFYKDNYFGSLNIGLGTYYQGIGDIQLGIFMKYGSIKNEFMDFKEKNISFTITYFF
jgi:hypothetical protein